MTIHDIDVALENSIKHRGIYPDYLMLHELQSHRLVDDIQKISSQYFDGKPDTCFGIKIIWTESIGLEDIIFTFKSRE